MYYKMQEKTKCASNLVEMIGYHVRNAGIWTGPTGQGVHWLATLAIFCFLGNLITQFIALFMANNDAEKLFECFSILSFCSMAAFKLRSLCGKGERWRFLVSQVSILENMNSDYNSDTFCFKNYRDNYTKQFRSISTNLPRVYISTLVIFMISPFIECGYNKWHGFSSKYPHVLPGWAPLDRLNVIGYIFTVFLEIVSSIYCVFVHIVFDLTAVGLMIFICGQFLLLRDYSEGIGGKGKTLQISKERDDRAHARIIKCHVTLKILVNMITELGKLISDILGVYFFVATLTLCSVAVRLNAESLNAMQVASLLQYLGATLTQLFLFCYYGDAILHESSLGAGEGPYAVSVWALGPRIRRELAMLAIGMAQTRHLRAGPFNSLDLPSFIQILRAAYSYYAVLRK